MWLKQTSPDKSRLEEQDVQNSKLNLRGFNSYPRRIFKPYCCCLIYIQQFILPVRKLQSVNYKISLSFSFLISSLFVCFVFYATFNNIPVISRRFLSKLPVLLVHLF